VALVLTAPVQTAAAGGRLEDGEPAVALVDDDAGRDRKGGLTARAVLAGEDATGRARTGR